MWTLVLIVISVGGVAIDTSLEFISEESCLSAKARIEQSAHFTTAVCINTLDG
jgi:hypothetical protein